MDSQALSSSSFDLARTLENGSQAEILSAAASKLLTAPDSVIALFLPLLPELLSRWRSKATSQAETLFQILIALGKILSFVPELSHFAAGLLEAIICDLPATAFLPPTELIQAKAKPETESLERLLLAHFRLLKTDFHTFNRFTNLSNVLSCFGHSSRVVRYLAIRVFSISLGLADAATEACLAQYLGTGPVEGAWESVRIDYTFLTLWEQKRNDSISSSLASISDNDKALMAGFIVTLDEANLSPHTIKVANIILPRTQKPPASKQTEIHFVSTETATSNLRRLAEALLSNDAVLLTGLAGSGKSLLINYLSELTGKQKSMITLHLNEQTDSRVLLGMYSSGAQSGTFQWNDGVLTTAVKEGRWLLIEDLDRAPDTVVSLFLPLLERGELPIPSRGETLKAADGFRIFATMRTNLDSDGNQKLPRAEMLGHRFWRQVQVESPEAAELKQLILTKYPSLSQHISTIESLFFSVSQLFQSKKVLSQSTSGTIRPFSTTDLLKWCARCNHLLSSTSVFTDDLLDSMFLHAVECFADSLPHNSLRESVIAAIAKGLQIDPQRRDFLVQSRTVNVTQPTSGGGIAVGRVSLPPFSSTGLRTQSRQLDLCQHTLRYLEKLCTAVLASEPVLLVGETGIGKTATIQHLASSTGVNLDVFNMSQQSESGDLLGSFKPVTIPSLLHPLRQEFEELFTLTFGSNKNQKFAEMLNKAFAKKQWRRVIKLWSSALDTYTSSLQPKSTPESQADGEASRPAKKRKQNLDSHPESPFYARWMAFSNSLAAVESRVSQDDGKPVFTFVEGNFIRAVRTGGWVLLDEVNLASLDTLEPILDLLGSSSFERRFITLAESGEVTEIEAHPNFRIFGAMNPATDVGKRDLPMSIRTRFTEIYVSSPDSDKESLRSIVGSYIRGADLDRQLPTDATDLYLAIQALSKSNQIVDGANERPHFSLRTLTRALIYANDNAGYVPYRRALAEGFEMSFATSLDINSSTLVMPLIWKFLKVKPSTKDTAEALQNVTVDEESNTVRIGSGRLPRGKGPITEMNEYIITPFIAKNINNLVRAISTRRYPILLQGPTSSGKTSMIEYLAKRSGNHCVRINNHEHTDLQEYLGSYVSQGGEQLVFQDGALVKAMREGHWVILDELNLAPSEILEALNRLLDDNRELFIPETQETVRPHPNFVLFATQNPAGLYGGRKHLSRAFRNRFLELHFEDIPVAELSFILHKRAAIPESWSKRIVDVYKKLSVMRQSNRMFESKSFATLRDLFRWAGRPVETMEDLAMHGYMLLGERVRNEEEKVAVRETIEECMSKNHARVRIDVEKLYSGNIPALASINSNQNLPNGAAANDASERSSNNTSIVYTPAMKRLLTLLHHAFANNEPVLLIGETGCGKTTGCQVFAELVKQKLYMVNAHQNTEAGDLLGSQRPIRNRAALESELMADVNSALDHLSLNSENGSGECRNGEKPISLVDALARLDASSGPLTSSGAVSTEPTGGSIPLDLQSSIAEKRKRLSMLFEWSDGPLVQAMRSGSFFLLDEISLAEDSVLERLNSVLESSKYLYLAEKGSGNATAAGTDDDDARVHAAPGFQFIATMNPGGDYGKRELSPALRNRFTEIWVPSLTFESDVLEVIRKHLDPAAQAYAPGMIDFAGWFTGQFNSSTSVTAASAAGTSKHQAHQPISIRAMLTWRDFINAHIGTGPLVSIVHGAAMVFVDSLGANPAGLMGSVQNDVNILRKRCFDKMSGVFGCDVAALLFGPVSLELHDEKLTIGPFTFNRLGMDSTAASAKTNSDFNFSSQTTLRNTLRLFRALHTPRPILLEGSPGVGKTTLVLSLASLLRKPITRMNLSEQTDLMDLFGSDVPSTSGVGRFEWKDAPFLTAMKKGDWVLLDEMNLASQSVLEGLNACLDHRGEVYISELGMSFRKHPDFRVFATQNPHHQGGGRKGLPASFVDRFTVVYADTFAPEDLKIIAAHSFPDVLTETVEKVVDFTAALDLLLQRRVLGAAGSPWEFNLRDVGRWMKLLSAKRNEGLRALEPTHFLEVMCVNRFRTTKDRDAVRQLFRSLWGVEIPEPATFNNLTPTHYQVGLSILPRSQLLSVSNISGSESGMKRHLSPGYLESVALGLSLSWPILLVGGPGSGKTALINHLASLTGASVVHLSLSADTDSTDLIGGYEQVDPARAVLEIAETLYVLARAELARLIRDGGLEKSRTEIINLLDLLGDLSCCRSGADKESRILKCCQKWVAHANMFTSQLSTLILQLTTHLTNMSSSVSARFEWVDGVLIKALQSGHWLVLDHANLCSASVLDRLNSLLEPQGVLTVNEHSVEGTQSARRVEPHPNFRIFLTMDPKHGELSRAMRNRALEICLHQEDSSLQLSNETAEPNLTLSSTASSRFPTSNEARMFRFSNFVNGLQAGLESEPSTYNPSSMSDEESFSALVSVLFDHMALEDTELLSLFEQQISSGLVSLSNDQISILRRVFNLYPAVIPPAAYTPKVEEISNAILPPQSQPLHPLVNEMQILSRYESIPYNDLLSRASGVESLFTIGLLEPLLKPVRYLLSETYLRQGPHIVSASILIHKSLPFLIELLHTAFAAPTVSPSLIAAIQDFAFLWRRLVDSCTLPPGRSIPAINPSLLRIAGSKLGQILQQAVSDFGIPRGRFVEFESAILPLQLSTGLHMPAMWAAFRPVVAPSYDRLQELMKLEERADEIDALLQEMRIADESGRLEGVRSRMRQALELCVWNGNVPVDELVAVIDMGLKDLREKVRASVVPPPLDGLEGNDMVSYEPENAPEGPFFRSFFGAVKVLADLYSIANSSPGIDEISPANLRLLSSCAMLGAHKIKSEALAGIQNRKAAKYLDVLISQRRSSPSAAIAESPASAPDVSPDGPSLSLNALERVSQISKVTTLASCESVSYELSVLGKVSTQFVNLFFSREVELLEKLLVQLYAIVTSALEEAECENDDGEKDGIVVVDSDFVSRRKSLLAIVRTEYFSHVEAHLSRASSGTDLDPASFSRAWLFLGLSSLLLLTPDQAYDPAEPHILSRDSLCSKHKATTAQLGHLRTFLSGFAGREKSIRTAFYQARLDELGTPSGTALPFPRPPHSGLEELQQEFSRLLGEVRTLDGILRENVVGSLDDAAASIEQNVSAIVGRLGERYRGYEDLSTVVAGFAMCLCTGLRLYSIRTEPAVSNSESWSPVSGLGNSLLRELRSTPLLSSLSSSQLKVFTRIDLPDEQPSPSTLVQMLHRAAFLHQTGVGINTSINTLVSRRRTGDLSSIESIHSIFRTFYREWKTNLEKEHAEEAARSNWYSYKGEMDDDEEVNAREYASLFPGADGTEESEEFVPGQEKDSTLEKTVKSEEWIQTLAEIHEKIFTPVEQGAGCKSSEAVLFDLVDHVAKILQDKAQGQNGRGHMQLADSLPASVPYLLLSSAISSARAHITDTAAVSPTGSSTKVHNFYTDPHPSEARALLSLSTAIRTHFLRIANTFPEHATPRLVLKCVSEIEALPVHFPLQKLLTKTEVLYSTVHQWQQISSREYSAAEWYDRLTSLIIRWRQLELGSWSRLFELEERSCRTRAARWWFVAFENLVEWTEGMIEVDCQAGVGGEGSSGPGPIPVSHLDQLVGTLSTFLSTTPLGEFSSRLSLLSAFASHILVRSSTYPSLLSVHSALSNVLAYYSLYQPAVTEAIAKGKEALQKDVNTVIKLATWKDANIEALRQSARQSHQKLFKVVKKWRGVLGQGVEGIVASLPAGELKLGSSGTKGGKKSSGKGKADLPVAEAPNIDAVVPTLHGSLPTEALEKAHHALSTLQPFVDRPARFSNISTTASLIASLTTALRPSPNSSGPSPTEAPADFLLSYLTSLQASVTSLQKETPSAMPESEEEKDKIAHLKQQKRKLYLDVLRDLRHFGFKTNMSTEQLENQASVSIVFATCPAPSFPTSGPGGSPSTTVVAPGSILSDLFGSCSLDTPFLQLTHLMPQIRSAPREHSSDLSHDDVLRSVTLLESTFLHTIRQRSALARGLADWASLEAAVLVPVRNLNELFGQDGEDAALVLSGTGEAERDSLGGYYNKVALAIPFLAWTIKHVQDQGVAAGTDNSGVVTTLSDWKALFSTLIQKWKGLPELPAGYTSCHHQAWKASVSTELSAFGSNLDEISRQVPALSPVLAQLSQWCCSGDAEPEQAQSVVPTTQASEFVQRAFAAVDSLLASIQSVSKELNSIPTSTETKSWLVDTEKSIISVISSLRIQSAADHLTGLLDAVSGLDPRASAVPGAIFTILSPVLSQYELTCRHALRQLASYFVSLSSFGVFLCKTFIRLTTDGFCGPKDSQGGDESTGKLESGTGLGDGEGAEDISKDIGDDEDLGDLPDHAEKTEKDKDDDGDDKDGGLDVNDRDVDAEFEDASADEEGSDNESQDEDEKDDIDEDIGDVGEDDMELDEKMWDEPPEADKSQDAKDAKGQQQDEMAGNDDEQGDSDGDDDDGEEGQQGEDVKELEQPEGEEEEDSLAKKGEDRALDLPENLDFGEDEDDANEELDDMEMKDEMDVDEDEEAGDGEEKQADNPDDEGAERDDGEEEVEMKGESEMPEENEGEDMNEEEEEAADPHEPDAEQEAPEGEAEDHVMEDKPEDPTSAEPDANEDTSPTLDPNVQTDSQQDPNTEASETAAAQNSSTDNQDREQAPMPSEGQDSGSTENEDGSARQDTASAEKDNQKSEPEDQAAFRKLGDVLEKWYNKQVQNRLDSDPEAREKDANLNEKEMAKSEFEHLKDDEEKSDAQALGATDKAEGLDREKGIVDEEDEDGEDKPDVGMDEDESEDEEEGEKPQEGGDDMDVDSDDDNANDAGGAGTGDNEVKGANRDSRLDESGEDAVSELESEAEDDEEMMNDVSTFEAQDQLSESHSVQAQALWSQCESKTRVLSTLLTEQLRLVLEPTVAAKMRGDFRTGKRLNIKRIIPYIASDYKRDKIWMRRSVPSKRAYQILLAVDDSKSMAENGSALLALESVALVGRSLSLLEAGEVSVLGFGQNVFTAHEFGVPFSADAGAKIFEKFRFDQDQTDVKKVVDSGIGVLKTARERGSGSQAELWQLMIVISDGHCEDHDRIRQLVRRGQEERVMIVFVVVDADGEASVSASANVNANVNVNVEAKPGQHQVQKKAQQKHTSILNLRSASFEIDAAGNTQVVWKSYFDTFPFRWYVIVREIADIPGVLSGALRQWFSEVAGSS